MKTFRVQFLPVDGRSPYFMEIEASSKEEALSIAIESTTSDDDGIHVIEAEWQCDTCQHYKPEDNSGCHTAHSRWDNNRPCEQDEEC